MPTLMAACRKQILMRWAIIGRNLLALVRCFFLLIEGYLVFNVATDAIVKPSQAMQITKPLKRRQQAIIRYGKGRYLMAKGVADWHEA